MELEDVLSRIESRLKILGLSAHAASQAAKKPDAIRNLKRAVSKGDRRGITTDTLSALAPVLKTTPEWLFAGTGESEAGQDRNSVKIMGRIGAGAEILAEFEQVPHEGLYEIELPFPTPEDSIAFQIEGDSMYPRYDPGDVIICSREGVNAERVVGSEAAVKTAEGKRYLKRIHRGPSPGTFDLESHNAQPIRGVRIDWAAEIQGVVRSGQWRRR